MYCIPSSRPYNFAGGVFSRYFQDEGSFLWPTSQCMHFFLQRSSAIVDVWGWLNKHLKDVEVATLTTIHLHIDCAAKIEICERDENMAVNGKKDNHGDTVFFCIGRTCLSMPTYANCYIELPCTTGSAWIHLFNIIQPAFHESVNVAYIMKLVTCFDCSLESHRNSMNFCRNFNWLRPFRRHNIFNLASM